MSQTYALLLHGGAGVLAPRSYDPERTHMRELAETGKAMLEAGDAALDVVTEIVRRLEASGLYVAGKGASPNQPAAMSSTPPSWTARTVAPGRSPA